MLLAMSKKKVMKEVEMHCNAKQCVSLYLFGWIAKSLSDLLGNEDKMKPWISSPSQPGNPSRSLKAFHFSWCQSLYLPSIRAALCATLWLWAHDAPSRWARAKALISSLNLVKNQTVPSELNVHPQFRPSAPALFKISLSEAETPANFAHSTVFPKNGICTLLRKN